ncbi:MAG TPA: serine hydrolase [Thermoanaerobaculia bacterium]|nr:serine hydrolase [Thermoanaerobaculia bacterium]
MRRIVSASAFLLLAASLAGGATLDPKRVDAIVTATQQAWHLPGVSVAIVKDDRVVHLGGYGVKESGSRAPVTPSTLFQIASTSKAFTTTAMAMLADEKKLSWDDPVRKHLPYFHLADPCADSMVTLRDIVSHRTGLSRHDELWDNSPWSRTEVVRRIGSAKLSRPFRSSYQYHNILFIAAGEVVASAAGTTWDDFVRTRIFEPLGMTSTRTLHAEWTAAADRASGHHYDWKTGTITVTPGFDVDNLGPAGSIMSNARDMANWVRFHLGDGTFEGKKLVSAEALAETKTPHTIIRIEGSSRDVHPVTNILTYGLGWNVSDYRGELLVSHGGALNDFRTQVALLPKQKAGVVVMTNIDRGWGAIAIRNALLDLLVGRSDRDWSAHFLALDKRLIEEGEKAKREREAKRHRDTRPSREMEAYAGTYESPSHGAAAVVLENGRLILRWSRLEIPLAHWHYDVFRATTPDEEIDEEVVFRLDPEGNVKTLTMFEEEFVRK